MNYLNQKQIFDRVNTFLTKRPNSSLLLIGDTGIGKTAIVRGVAALNRVPCAIVNSAQEAAEEVGGIPTAGLERILGALVQIAAKPDDKSSILNALEEVMHSKYLTYKMPSWWEVVKNNDKGILFIDEPNRAPEDVNQALFSLIESGKKMLRNDTLPPGWLVCLAINPASKGYYQVRELAAAFKRRTFQFQVVHDNEAWIDWAMRNNIHDSILGLARVHADAIWTDPSKCEDPVPQTPAGWEEISDCIKTGVLDLNQLSKPEMRATLTGKIGEKPALQFTKYVMEKYSRPVMAKDIFEKPGWTKPIKEKFFEQQDAGKNDRMHASIEDILAYLRLLCENGKKIPDVIGTTLIKLINNKEFQTVYRSALVSGIVNDSNLEAVINILSSDNNIVELLTNEVYSNQAKTKS